MKLLYIANCPNSAHQVTSFSSMWKYHLRGALEANGVELVLWPEYHDSINPHVYADQVLEIAREEKCDHILYVGVRPFTQIPLEIGEYLKKHFKGLVTHIYDGSMLDCKQVDVTFTLRDDTYKYLDNPSRLQRHLDNNWQVGWAADPELFYPEKMSDGILRVFVDHALFDLSDFDYSLTMMMNLKNIPVPHVSYTLTDNGLSHIDESDIKVEEYHRIGVSSQQFAALLRCCDIFIVTHKESLGLTVLEAARCGALVVTKEGLIPKDRLESVEHHIVGSKINWDEILPKLNRTRIANKVKDCTWDNVAKNMIQGFKHMENTKCR